MQTHWMMKRVAQSLAREGLHVLRFDYLGTGDSAGDIDEASTGQWVEDIAAAAKELRALTGVRRVAAIGLRLGAGLLWEASLKGLQVETLVLWEPVVQGAKYLEELEALQAARQLYRLYPLPLIPGELLGVALPPALRQEIRRVDLLSMAPPAQRVGVFVGRSSPELEALRGLLAGATWTEIAGEGGAAPRSDSALLSGELVTAMTTFLTEKAA